MELKTFIEAGFRLIPLEPRSKRPTEKGYAEKKYTLSDLAGKNVGLILERGYVDIDYDWPEASRLKSSFIVPSRFEFGRRGRLTHTIVNCDLERPVSFKLPNVAGHGLTGEHAMTVLELRTTREGEPYHVMIPPSVHPNGDALEWMSGDDLIIEDTPDAILYCAGQLAACAALVRFYPGEGGRDDFITALIGVALRAGWSDEAIENIVGLVASHAGDEERDKRIKKVVKSRQRLEAGKKVRGLTSLAKTAGIPYEWAYEIAVWIGWRKRSGNGPVIFHDGLILNTARQAWQRLDDYVIRGNPAVYQHGEALARIDRKRIELLDRNGLTHELNRCAKWMRLVGEENGKPKFAASNADKAVVDDMLFAREAEVTVPHLNQLSTVPMFTSEGRLLNADGFDEDSGIFLDLSVTVDVPERPTRTQVWGALRQLWRPVAQFPYVDRSDRAHVLAMMLEPYVRDMFDAVPMYFVNKPAAGTGASLLIEAALFPTLGAFPEGETPPRSEEEMKKTLVSKLMSGTRVMYFDNANNLDSASLAAVITGSVFTGRILGRSQMATMPVRCQFVGSGNNTEMSGELYRRMVDIRIDAKMENPEDRPASTFRIKDLKVWVREHHAEQVRAALTIIRYWISKGMPHGSGHKASFEGWARVMSGIFECINVRGFLETPTERRPEDPKVEQFRSLILYWFNLARRKAENVPSDLLGIDWSKPVKAKDVAKLCRADGYDLGWGEEAKMAGSLLRQFDGRIFEFEATSGRVFRLKLAKRKVNGSFSWSVDHEVVGSGGGPDGLEHRDGLPF